MELIIDPGDRLALELQKLRAPGETLVRIDYRREAAQAPFQFDMANGTLHRRGCAAIPSNVSGALYAIWEPDGEIDAIGCNSCRPATVEASGMSQDRTLDVLYGLISIVDQFGSVLKDRGQEYRASAKGQKLAQDLDGVFSTLSQKQQEALQTTLDSLDGLVKAIESVKENGTTNGHGAAQHNGNHRATKEGR